VSLNEAWRRLGGLPRSAIGSAMAHFGVGMLVVGVVATSAYREERIVIMKPGEQLALSGYELTFKGVAPATGPNYREEVAVFDVTRGGAPVAHLEPARRIYDMPPEPTTEAGIHVAWRGDLYVVLGDKQNAGGYAVRAFFNPLVRFIWLGAVMMFLAGAVSLSDRRLRVGAPGRARRLAAAPAE
jgi:cytochrome c-type biogenesis protein CcmF